MKLVKAGSHRLFEQDQETAKTVSGMLLDLEKRDGQACLEYGLVVCAGACSD